MLNMTNHQVNTKTTMRYCFTSTGIALIIIIPSNVGKDVEKLTPSCSVGANV